MDDAMITAKEVFLEDDDYVHFDQVRAAHSIKLSNNNRTAKTTDNFLSTVILNTFFFDNSLLPTNAPSPPPMNSILEEDETDEKEVLNINNPINIHLDTSFFSGSSNTDEEDEESTCSSSDISFIPSPTSHPRTSIHGYVNPPFNPATYNPRNSKSMSILSDDRDSLSPKNIPNPTHFSANSTRNPSLNINFVANEQKNNNNIDNKNSNRIKNRKYKHRRSRSYDEQYFSNILKKKNNKKILSSVATEDLKERKIKNAYYSEHSLSMRNIENEIGPEIIQRSKTLHNSNNVKSKNEISLVNLNYHQYRSHIRQSSKKIEVSFKIEHTVKGYMFIGVIQANKINSVIHPGFMFGFNHFSYALYGYTGSIYHNSIDKEYYFLNSASTVKQKQKDMHMHQQQIMSGLKNVSDDEYLSPPPPVINMGIHERSSSQHVFINDNIPPVAHTSSVSTVYSNVNGFPENGNCNDVEEDESRMRVELPVIHSGDVITVCMKLSRTKDGDRGRFNVSFEVNGIDCGQAFLKIEPPVTVGLTMVGRGEQITLLSCSYQPLNNDKGCTIL